MPADRRQRVGQCRGRELRRARGRARRAESGLHPSGAVALRDDDDVVIAAPRACRARCGSPPIVPVTFERPTRARYATGTSSMRQPADPARSTISSGQPKRRSRTEGQELLATGRPHRTEIGDRDTRAPLHRAGEGPVRGAQVPRPGTRVGLPGAEDEIGVRRRPARRPARDPRRRTSRRG